MATIGLATPLVELAGVGPRFVRQLARLGLRTVRDLLWHFPSRYEDFSQIYAIADLEPGQQATVTATVEDIKTRHSWRRRMTLVEATLADDTASIRAVWFNQPYIAQVLRIGRIANFVGKVSFSEGELYLSHPTYELLGRNEFEETRHTGRLVPIYPETRGLTSKGIRFLVQPMLRAIGRLRDWIPGAILDERGLPELDAALRNIHFPKTLEDATSARRRFEFEDLFLLQLWNFKQKLSLAREKAPAIPTDIGELKAVLGHLPFELTLTQKHSLWEIIQDLGKPRPMNRLLQGDVGSGKTVVAALAAFVAAKSLPTGGLQSAFMAPTEVLARQHFKTLTSLLGRIGNRSGVSVPSVGLLAAGGAELSWGVNLAAKAKKSELVQKIASGEIAIAIGTHALIQKSVRFKNLGLVIVDEQHRFGVRQRQALARGQTWTNTLTERESPRQSALVPHFLSMSATPIPRTLMLTVFGDLDISTITELPAGRKNILTKIVAPENRPKAYAFIHGEVKKGRQAFVICPRIEPPDPAERLTAKEFKTLELKSVKEEHEKLSKRVFPDLRVEMLHGQMKSKEKERIMNEFRAGAIDILVSTSVIEVGVDVPNATIMMIEGAERFGLAQLYQFRGRVGRGAHQSFCFLFTESSSKTTNARLKAILEAKNGFELAEKDLAIRGPGEFLGETQTGFPDVAMSALRNIEHVKAAREAAAKLLTEDPGLKRYPLVREKLSRFRQTAHFE